MVARIQHAVEAFIETFCPDGSEAPDLLAGLRTLAMTGDPALLAIAETADDRSAGGAATLDLFRWILQDGRWRYRWLRDRFTAEACTRMARRWGDPPWLGNLSHLMNLVWAAHPHLHETFPLRNAGEAAGFAAWYRIHGLRELKLYDLASPEQRRFQMQPDPELPSTGPVMITRFLGELWRQRHDLVGVFDPFTPAGRIDLLTWYLFQGMHEYRCHNALSREQIDLLAGPSTAVSPDGHPDIPLFLFLLWRTIPHIRKHFSIDSPQGRAHLKAWFEARGYWELGIDHWPKALRERLTGPKSAHLLHSRIACIQPPDDPLPLALPSDMIRVLVGESDTWDEASVLNAMSSWVSPSKVILWSIPASQAARLLLRIGTLMTDAASNILLVREDTAVPPLFAEAWTLGGHARRRLLDAAPGSVGGDMAALPVEAVTPCLEPSSLEPADRKSLGLPVGRTLVCIPVALADPKAFQAARSAAHAVRSVRPPKGSPGISIVFLTAEGGEAAIPADGETLVIGADAKKANQIVMASDLLLCPVPPMSFDLMEAYALFAGVPVIGPAGGPDGPMEADAGDAVPAAGADGVCDPGLLATEIGRVLQAAGEPSAKARVAQERELAVRRFGSEASKASVLAALDRKSAADHDLVPQVAL